MKLSPSPKQGEAIDAVARWYKANEKPVFRVFGYAGTGKTSIARFFAETIKGTVHYMAFTGKASLVMRKSGCIGATTIHASIYDTKQDEETGYVKFRRKAKKEMEHIKLFVVDECSMVDEEIAKHIQSYNIPVLVLGDPGQLPPVSGGGYYTNADPDVMLEEIHRQAADNPIVRLATDVREGRRLQIGNYGAAQVISRNDVTQELVLEADQIVVGKNATRDRYNKRLRQLKGFTEALPQPGDKLVALKNDHDLGIMNGGLFEMIGYKPRRKMDVKSKCLNMIVKSTDFDAAAMDVKVRPEFFDGNPKSIPWRELKGTQQFDYGYALTVHKAQGSGWENVVAFDESAAFGADGQRHLYTAITRASERLTLVV